MNNEIQSYNDQQTETDKEICDLLAKTIDKNSLGVPVDIKGPDFTTYVELLAREENNCVWYTPEEMGTILSQNNKKKIQAAFKEK